VHWVKNSSGHLMLCTRIGTREIALANEAESREWDLCLSVVSAAVCSRYCRGLVRRLRWDANPSRSP
jgi:hypothetical protein